jgi:hypothetical protein
LELSALFHGDLAVQANRVGKGAPGARVVFAQILRSAGKRWLQW